MSGRRRRWSDPRRPVSPWAAVVSVLVCLGIVGAVSAVTPTTLSNVGYRDQGADGVAQTENVRVRVARAYVAAAIQRDATSPPATTDGSFVIVEYEATFLKRQPSLPLITFVSEDGRKFRSAGRSDITFDSFTGSVGFTTKAAAVFEVPWDAVDGGRFIFGPEAVDGLQPYQSAARLRLPDPLPRAAGIVTLPKQTVEVAR